MPHLSIQRPDGSVTHHDVAQGWRIDSTQRMIVIRTEQGRDMIPLETAYIIQVFTDPGGDCCEDRQGT